MRVFELARGAPELRESFFEMIGKRGHAEKIARRSRVMRARRLRAEIVPVFDRPVAASRPNKFGWIFQHGPDLRQLPKIMPTSLAHLPEAHVGRPRSRRP